MNFIKPTLPEVLEAMTRHGLPAMEAEKFINYYESNGWMVGKVRMKSWPHAIANWKIHFVERGGNLLAPVTTEIPPHIAALHRAYEQASGMTVTMTPERLATWGAFIKFRAPPFNADDIRVVVRQIQFEIKHKNSKRLYSFRNLIGQPAFFEEDLGRAREAMRSRPSLFEKVQTGSTQRIVQAMGTKDATRSVEEVIEAMRREANQF